MIFFPKIIATSQVDSMQNFKRNTDIPLVASSDSFDVISLRFSSIKCYVELS